MKLEKKQPIDGDYTTCTGMCGSGAGTGTEVTQADRRLIPWERLPVPTAWDAAAVGTTVCGIFVQLTGSTTSPTSGASASAFGSFVPEL